jgi:hypothetical protein
MKKPTHDKAAALDQGMLALALEVMELRAQLRETLAALRSLKARRAAALEYLATAESAKLRKDLIAARGAQSAATFRTKLNADLEQRRGRRHPANGSPMDPTHGNGALRA